MIEAGTRLAASVAGDVLIYVIAPLIVVSIIGMVAWARSIGKTLATQDRALALLVQETLPDGQPSLRSVVNSVSERLARVEGELHR
jgi:hypothetical protein